MKRSVLIFAGLALFAASCKEAPKADVASAGAAQEVANASGMTYATDLAQSYVTWIGTKPVGQHQGKMLLENGSLALEDGKISGGKFDIAIGSMQSMDEDTSGAHKLLGHLKSPDFFDVATHPLASFEITSVREGLDEAVAKNLVMKDATHTVQGNLTLKGVTKSISFPAKLVVNEHQVTAVANFNIDRTLWGLSYGNDESLKDKFIRPMVNIGLTIVANKA
ncbi:MAG: YceI family protein [Bacteroidetes bacterium]|nr:YceI family protein [Bacteroidota bacterium]